MYYKRDKNAEQINTTANNMYKPLLATGLRVSHLFVILR